MNVYTASAMKQQEGEASESVKDIIPRLNWHLVSADIEMNALANVNAIACD